MRTKMAKRICKDIFKRDLAAGSPVILQKYLDEVRDGFRELEESKVLEWRKLDQVRNVEEEETTGFREYYRKGRYHVTEDEDKLVDLKIEVEYELKKEIRDNLLALDFTEKEIAEIFAFVKNLRGL